MPPKAKTSKTATKTTSVKKVVAKPKKKAAAAAKGAAKKTPKPTQRKAAAAKKKTPAAKKQTAARKKTTAPKPAERKASSKQQAKKAAKQTPSKKTTASSPKGGSVKKMDATAALKHFRTVDENAVGTFELASDGQKAPTVVIGNLQNAIEGTSQAAAGIAPRGPKDWKSLAGGTVLARDVSMQLPAKAGSWRAATLHEGCGACGAVFWHADAVGPAASDALELLQWTYTAGEMAAFDYDVPSVCRERGVEMIGRYEWDWTRCISKAAWPPKSKFPFTMSEASALFNSEHLFEGPACFFAPPALMTTDVLPALKVLHDAEKAVPQGINILQRGADSGDDSAPGRGALCALDLQEYMWGRPIFDPATGQLIFLAFYTYSLAEETFEDCAVADADGE